MFTNAFRTSCLGVLVALAAGLAAIQAPAAAAHGGPHAAGGRSHAIGAPCGGGHRIMFTSYCTHGPDPEPTIAELRRSVPAVIGGSVPKVECVGNGTSGKRVQVIYARASNVADGYVASKAAVAAGAIDADRVFRESAAETSGNRHLRFVHDASCNLSILNVVLAESALAPGDVGFGLTIAGLQGLGHNRVDRKYLVFVDDALDPANDANCGIGTLVKWDDQPGAANASNGGPGYSRIGPSCWNVFNSAAAHELMHNLGAVQNSAPNWNGVGHCLDDTDRMCYSQNVPGFVFNPSACLNHERLFDCNHDDYFHTDPAAGSYLDTHWNTADSDYLSSSHGEEWAFVRGNDPAAASYTPSVDFNQNSTNAANTVTRASTGTYAVGFTNLADFSAPYGVVLVTAYGTAGEFCNAAWWNSMSSADMSATVDCFDAAGNRADVQFDASLVRPSSTTGDYAYLWADHPTWAGPYITSTTHQFNSAGGLNEITRNGTGDYQVRLPGLGGAGGTVKVTAFSSFARTCKAASWSSSAGDKLVDVLCFDLAGAPVDETFTLAYANGLSILGNGAASGSVLANDANATVQYVPAAADQFNSTGGSNTVTHTGTGLYTVVMPGLGDGGFVGSYNRGLVHVTASNTTSKRCEVSRWYGTAALGGSSSLVADVACHTAAGAPADSRFALQFTK